MEVNNSYRAMIGYTSEELCSMFIYKIEAVDDDETTKNHIEKIISSGSDKFESVHRSKDGNLIPVEVGVKYNSGNNHIYAFIKDIIHYIRDHTDTQFSHSICPDCAKKLYPDLNL